jgi:predicted dehydrogenase
MTRRSFISSSLTAGVAAWALAPAVLAAESPANKVFVGVMGTSRNSIGSDGRGTELARGLATLPGVEVAYICDVDSRNIEKAIASVVTKTKQTKPPKGVVDFRRILDDQNVNALVIATPDHWHAPATILACAAGNHV